MDELVSKQAAIDAIKDRYYKYGRFAKKDELIYALEGVPPTHPDNQVHLCDSCSYTYPECPSVYTDVIFGNGMGNDNICACSKYLPSAHPEPCEDAVSREEVLNCLEWQYPDKLPRTKIMELPPVTPKQRTGKWIKADVCGDITSWECSCCHRWTGLPTGWNVKAKLLYCPKCGVKMEGSAE